MEAHALVARCMLAGDDDGDGDGCGPRPTFPFLCLLVSGGHNVLLVAHELGRYTQLGGCHPTVAQQTGARRLRDDATGALLPGRAHAEASLTDVLPADASCLHFLGRARRHDVGRRAGRGVRQGGAHAAPARGRGRRPRGGGARAGRCDDSAAVVALTAAATKQRRRLTSGALRRVGGLPLLLCAAGDPTAFKFTKPMSVKAKKSHQNCDFSYAGLKVREGTSMPGEGGLARRSTSVRLAVETAFGADGPDDSAEARRVGSLAARPLRRCSCAPLPASPSAAAAGCS
eukprot:scaffold1067_cov253-Prasinococcus_capsulatus_cf.AAC.5